MSEKLELNVKPEVLTKEVETELLSTQKVEEKTVEKSLNYETLTEAEKKAIDEFITKVNVEDTTQILQYGATAQTKISKFSDSVLENVKTIAPFQRLYQSGHAIWCERSGKLFNFPSYSITVQRSFILQ